MTAMAPSPLEHLVGDPAKARALFHLLRADIELRTMDLTSVLRCCSVHAIDHPDALPAIREWIRRNDLRDGLLYELGLIDVEPEDEVLSELRAEGFGLREAPEWETGDAEAGLDCEAE